MKTNKFIKSFPKYIIIEKEITENAIINDLIYDNKYTQISFSYKTETLIQFMYYCLTYFFKSKTYAESFHNIKLSGNDNKTNDSSYLFKLKLILPNLLKLIIKYLSTKNSWFNFTFHGIELINLIICFESGNNKSPVYNSLLNYLLNLKYRLINDKNNNNIFYTNWFTSFINIISDIITEIISSNLMFLKSTKNKLYDLLGLDNNKEKYLCNVCKKIPTNSIYFKCGHIYCYYCYFYNSKLLFPQKNIKNICLICKDELKSI